SADDALYLGDDKPFDYAVITRQYNMGGTVNAAFSYWNGSAWAPLSTTRNEFGHADGDASFSPPSDWAASGPTAWPAGPTDASLASAPAYWLKVTAAAGAPTSILVGRVSGIKNLTSPATPAFFDPAYDPLSWSDMNPSALNVVLSKYDSVPPQTGFVDALPNPFTPNADGSRDSTYIQGHFKEDLRLTAEVRSLTGTLLTQQIGSGPDLSISWDGKLNGTTQLPGEYETRFNLVDDAGNTASQSTWVISGPGPWVTGSDKSIYQIGERLVLSGSNLGAGVGEHQMSLDGQPMVLESWSPTSIVGFVPPDISPGPHSLGIWEAGVSSNSVTVTVSNSVTPKTGEQIIPGRVAFKMKPGEAATSVDPSAVALFGPSATGDLSRWFEVTKTAGTEATWISTFSADSRVEWAEFEGTVMPAATYPHDPMFQQQWGLEQAERAPDINAPQAWDISKVGGSVSIAFIDSGIGAHPDLDANNAARNGSSLPGRDYTSTGLSTDGCIGTDIGAHGTAVAGAAAAVTDNNLGIAGVGWNTIARPYKVFGSSSGHCVWIATSALASVIADAGRDGNKVIDISAARYSTSALRAEQDAIAAVEGSGSLVVAAAGNTNNQDPAYPAAYVPVLSVGALNADASRWNPSSTVGSNYGSSVDVYAPGASVTTTVISTAGSPSYASYDGTSMASSFAAGAAALVMALPEHPTATSTYSALVQTAAPAGSNSWPMLNAHWALFNTHPVNVGAGRFFTLKEDGSVWFIDLNANVRQVLDLGILASWGESKVSLLILDRAQFANFIVDRDRPIGFRPGSLADPSPLLTAPGTAVTDNPFLISNDAQLVGDNTDQRWTSGKPWQVTTCTAQLGYKLNRVRLIDPMVWSRIYHVTGQWTDCTKHPDGTIIPTQVAPNTTPGAVYLLEAGKPRVFEGTNWAEVKEIETVFRSWGVGEYTTYRIDPTCSPPLMNECYHADNDIVIGGPISASEVALPHDNWLLGMRPGIPGRFYDSTIGQDAYIIARPTEIGDFAFGPQQRIRETGLGCYAYNVPLPELRVPMTVVNAAFSGWMEC
ncbi:MAG: S8 family serine peptidase, partial [Actinomycetota bacterium]